VGPPCSVFDGAGEKKYGRKRLKTNYTASSDKISFTTRSLAEDGIKAEQFSFLGLKGDFDLYIDREQKIPVQVSGKLLTYGKVDI